MIKNFDKEAYLDANPDVKAVMENGDFPSVEVYLEQFGLKRIAAGKSKFHKDLGSFNETIYLEEFPEVQSLVNNGEFISVFDHFCRVGYSTLLQYLQIKNDIIEESLELESDTLEDTRHIKGFDEEAYLDVNPDVKETVQKGDFPSVEVYLEKFGLKRIEGGVSRFHKDFEPFDEQLYLDFFDEVREEIEHGYFASGFEHFCRLGYAEIIANSRDWNSHVASPKDGKEPLQSLSEIISEKHIVKFLAGLNLDDYISANQDILSAIEKATFVSAEDHLKKIALYELFEGKRKLHSKLSFYDEESYVDAFADVRRLIKRGRFSSGFEHYLLQGYKEILSGKREYKSKMDEEETSLPFAVDNALLLDSHTLFISGWTYDTESDYVSLSTPSALDTVDIFYHKRSDLQSTPGIQDRWEKAGFFGLIRTEEDLDDGFIELIAQKGDGSDEYIMVPIDEEDDPKIISQKMLSYLQLKSGFREILEKSYGSALNLLWEDYYKKLELDPKEKIYGEIPENPAMSIIIPLYGRVDFMEYQSAIFATDDLIRNTIEIIYVLDDPDRFYDVIDDMSRGVYQLYQVPFKVISYEENLGYARANNMGVKYATSEMILLLNSDVFPKTKGWTERLLEIYATLESPGVLGCKLLFEDDSIQHAGMEFVQNPYLDDMWTNIHPHKGLPDIDKSFVVKEVPAVTGACMLLEKSHYIDVGGLTESYVLGDFEDSDLCLKLMEKGLKVYYSSEPVLYHLERQSQSLFDDQAWKHKITVYNCWQQTNRWNDTIRQTMERFDG